MEFWRRVPIATKVLCRSSFKRLVKMWEASKCSLQCLSRPKYCCIWAHLSSLFSSKFIVLNKYTVLMIQIVKNYWEYLKFIKRCHLSKSACDDSAASVSSLTTEACSNVSVITGQDLIELKSAGLKSHLYDSRWSLQSRPFYVTSMIIKLNWSSWWFLYTWNYTWMTLLEQSMCVFMAIGS